jgi:dTDP-D-glucose 4,6-dehydratase
MPTTPARMFVAEDKAIVVIDKLTYAANMRSLNVGSFARSYQFLDRACSWQLLEPYMPEP